MRSLNFHRISAYLVDMLIIIIIITLLSEIKFINPKSAEYEKAYKEYTTYYNEVLNQDLTNYDISSDTKMTNLTYKLAKYSIGYKIIEIGVVILYFTLFPTFNNNQTIGKRLFKIKIENKEENKKVTIFQHFLRSLFEPVASSILIYNTITTISSVLLVLLLKKSMYIQSAGIVELIFCVFCYADVIFALFRKDHRALHDIITKTKVVEK